MPAEHGSSRIVPICPIPSLYHSYQESLLPSYAFFLFRNGEKARGHLSRTGSVSDDKNSLADLDPVSVETTQVLVGPYN